MKVRNSDWRLDWRDRTGDEVCDTLVQRDEESCAFTPILAGSSETVAECSIAIIRRL